MSGMGYECCMCGKRKNQDEVDPVSGGEFVCFDCYDRMMEQASIDAKTCKKLNQPRPTTNKTTTIFGDAWLNQSK